MLKYFILLIFLISSYRSSSQTVCVKSFCWVETNGYRYGIPVNKNPKLKSCPIIKVITTQTGIDFGFGLSGKALAKTQRKGEIFLWVLGGSESITITDKKSGGIYIYHFGKELEDKEVYEMVLNDNSKRTSGKLEVETKWIFLQTKYGEWAKIHFDDNYIGKTPYIGSFPLGKHKLRMELNGEKKESILFITEGTKSPIVIGFKPVVVPVDTRKVRPLDEGNFEQNPEYPGGYEQMSKFIRDNLRHPVSFSNKNLLRTVFVAFNISETGKISDVHILRGISFDCDKEAIRIVKMMPKWIPGREYGSAIPIMYQIPIRFPLQQN